MKHTPEPATNRIRAAVEMIEQGKDWYMEEIDALRYDLAKSIEREADLLEACNGALQAFKDDTRSPRRIQANINAIERAIKKAEGDL